MFKNTLFTWLTGIGVCITTLLLITCIAVMGAKALSACDNPMLAPGQWCRVGPVWLAKLDQAAQTGACALAPGDTMCCVIDGKTCCMVTVRDKPEVACE